MMADHKGEAKKQPHLSTKDDQQPPQQGGGGAHQESTEATPIGPPPIISSSINPKRPRLYTPPGQWKLLPSPSQQQHQQMNILLTTEASTPSPSPRATANPQLTPHTAAASSSDTASSPPPHSPPHPSHSPVSASQETVILAEGEKPHHPQSSRKGKYVSPVWKPNEMLWLAKAWRVQYQEGGVATSSSSAAAAAPPGAASRGKTRADKDKEVAEFLNRHGVQRDSKTAGTKWDNMLGEFRKVFDWERGCAGGGEREQQHGNKSYFRLSPYERKMHRLPASFDEEVFDELCQFMGPRMRSSSHQSSTRGGGGGAAAASLSPAAKSLPPPPMFREDELPLSARAKQLVMSSGTSTEGGLLYSTTRGGGATALGFEAAAGATTSSLLDIVGGGVPSSSTTSASSRELRRIGKVRMVWEESVNLWAEEGEHHRGRVKLSGSSFLNADELAFLDEAMVACTMEAFEDGPSKGFSVDRFLSGQQIKVFGRRKSSSTSTSGGSIIDQRVLPAPPSETSIRSITQLEFQDPTEYYMGCLRVPPPNLPSLFELSWHLQEPPPEEFRFPLRKDVYRDLPQGKELFFTTSSSELIDCRATTFDILSPVMRSTTSLSATTRDSFIGLWDDCINTIVSKFCAAEMVFVRKPSSSSSFSSPSSSPLPEMESVSVQDQWPNVTGFLKNLCLWRGEETDQLREGQIDPSSSIAEKLLWTFMDLPYILGYYAVGYIVTFCALSRSAQDDRKIVRTDLYTLDLSTPAERLKALIPCYRIAGLLHLLADKCMGCSDFERIDLGGGNLVEMTPNLVVRQFPSKRRWAAVKEIYEFLGQRIPHAEYLIRSIERDLILVFKPRGVRNFKPANCDELIEALKVVTKALVALHDLSFMHRDLSWEKVMRRIGGGEEWVVGGFDEAMSSPQIYPHGGVASGRHAPEMVRGLHTVKVDVWGVGQLIKTCGLMAAGSGVPKLLMELQNRCLDHNPEQRPTAADCYRHLLQLQSSMSAAAAGGY